jgi:trimeric autotransporter adhesin
MASITDTSGFNANDMWNALAGAPILSNGTTYRFQNATGEFVEVTGSGFTYSGGLPAAGTYTSIKVYGTSAFTGTPVSTYTSATAVNFATYFTSGLATALAGPDTFNGSAGADTFRGGLGTDSMSGGAGNDTFHFSFGDNDGVETINGGGDIDRIVVSGTGETNFADDVITSIEQLEVHNGSNAVFNGVQAAALAGLSVTGDGGVDQIRIEGTLAGENIDLSNWNFTGWDNYGSLVLIQMSTGNARDDTIIGSNVRDLIHGETGNDRLEGRAGDDHLNGGAGFDTLLGGPGDDSYVVENYDDTIIELANEGNEDIILSAVSYILPANIEKLRIWDISGAADGIGNELNNELFGNDSRNSFAGGAGNDTLYGNGGDDILNGDSGADIMIGGTGIDTYYVDDAGDQVIETETGPGKYDTVWSTLSDYTLPVNVEIYIATPNAGAMNAVGNDDVTLMLGNEGANAMSSLAGNDMVLGQGGDDTINGGAGDLDIISGGTGADQLTGGGGHDYFVYQFIAEGGDTITDFQTNAGVEDDIVDFRAMFFPTFTNTAGITTVAQAVASGHLTYTQAGANTQVYADANGGAHAPGEQVLMATLLNTTAASVQVYTLI